MDHMLYGSMGADRYMRWHEAARTILRGKSVAAQLDTLRATLADRLAELEREQKKLVQLAELAAGGGFDDAIDVAAILRGAEARFQRWADVEDELLKRVLPPSAWEEAEREEAEAAARREEAEALGL